MNDYLNHEEMFEFFKFLGNLSPISFCEQLLFKVIDYYEGFVETISSY